MSHIADIDLEIKDLDALEQAADDIGAELVRGKQTYKWYGRRVGSEPLPAGLTEADLGKCDHAIRVRGAGRDTYEVGVRKNPDGTFRLLWDYWQGGYGLTSVIGNDAGRLRQSYSARVAMKALRRKGLRVNRSINEQGDIVLRAR